MTKYLWRKGQAPKQRKEVAIKGWDTPRQLWWHLPPSMYEKGITFLKVIAMKLIGCYETEELLLGERNGLFPLSVPPQIHVYVRRGSLVAGIGKERISVGLPLHHRSLEKGSLRTTSTWQALAGFRIPQKQVPIPSLGKQV